MKKWIPEQYQKQGYQKIVANACCGLLWRPGLRKTSTILKAISILKKKGVVNRVLLIAPPRVARLTWPEEIDKWSDFSHLSYIDLTTSRARDERVDTTDADILIISCEVAVLRWFFWTRELHKKFDVDMLVIDESSRFKNGTATRFKGYPRDAKGKIVDFPGLKYYIPFFKRRVVATGSPRPRTIENLWSQIYLLDGGLTLGGYISHFRRRYMVQTGYGGYTYLPKPGSEKEIMDAIKPFVHVIGDERLNLPELTYEFVEVELPPKARGIYKELEKEFITEVESGVVKAANAGVASNKCRQLANGAIYTESLKEVPGMGTVNLGSRRVHTVVHDEKLKALGDIIESLDGEQLLVCYEFKHDLERLEKYLGKYNLGVLGKTIKQDKRVKEGWNNGALQIVIGHPASIGLGLNLQESNAFNIAFFGLTWDFELFYQVIRRLLRSGNDSSYVVCWVICAKDTVDQVVWDSLQTKEAGEQQLFDVLTTYVAAKGGSLKLSVTTAAMEKTVSEMLQKNSTEEHSQVCLEQCIISQAKAGRLKDAGSLKRYVRKWWEVDFKLRGLYDSNKQRIAKAIRKTDTMLPELTKLLHNRKEVNPMTTAKAKKPQAKASAKAPVEKTRIADTIRDGILAGKTNDQILALVKKKHKDAKTTSGSISVQRSQMRKFGVGNLSK